MRDDIDLAAAGASHIGRVAARFHLKFLDRIGRRAQVLRIKRGIGICGAVQEEEVRIRPAAADHHGGALPRTPVKRIRGSRLRAKPDVGAGHGEHQVNQHAPIEGQFANGGGLDHLSNAGVGRLQDFAAGRDFYSLRDGANPQADIHCQFLAHLQPQRLLCRS